MPLDSPRSAESVAAFVIGFSAAALSFRSGVAMADGGTKDGARRIDADGSLSSVLDAGAGCASARSMNALVAAPKRLKRTRKPPGPPALAVTWPITLASARMGFWPFSS